MNRFLTTIIISFLALSAAADTWFPYPVAPESLPYGRPRANYIVELFWERCPWKSAYSSTARMEETIRDFATYLPHAQSDTVFMSIHTLIDNSQKRPSDFQALLNMAEATFYSDSATTFSGEVYLPFAEAGAKYKKFKPEQRAHYARQASIITNSQEGNSFPAVDAVDINGSKSALNDTAVGAETYIFFFERPEAGRTDRVLFAGNISVRKLVEAGLVQPILVCAGEPDEAWWESTKRLPEGWKAVALPNANELFDLRNNPSIYLTDKSMKIVSQLMPLNLLKVNCEQLVKNAGL